MGHRKRLLVLLLILFSVSLTAGGIAIAVLYRASMEQQRARLIETAQSQARLLEAVARYDAQYTTEEYPQGAAAATLSQIIDAHENYKGFGKTGEFTLSRREGHKIIFLLSHRHYDMDHPRPLLWDSVLSEPERRALSGESGTVIALDYRETLVLAAYEPVQGLLDWGIVAKIDLAEIRAPFIKAAVVAGAGAFFVISLGVLLFIGVTNPLIMELEESESRTRAIVETAIDAIITTDEKGVIEYFNPSAERLFGYSSKDALGQSIGVLLAPPYGKEHLQRIAEYLETDDVMTFKSGREVVGARKNGTAVPIYLAVSDIRLEDRVLFTGIIHDLTHRRQTEEEKDRLLATLNRRNTELSCLYRTGEVVRSGDLDAGMFREIVKIVHQAAPRPGVVGTRITFDGRAHTSDGFEETPWDLTAEITSSGRKRGTVEVFFLKEQPDTATGQTHQEERNVIAAVAVILGEAAERKEAEAKVIHASTLASIGELAAGVGHEINNPVNGIMNCADIVVKNAEKGSKIEKFGIMIRSEADRIAIIVRDLLTFSRREKTVHSPARLYDVVSAVLTLCRSKLSKSYILLTIDVPEDLPKIDCRSEQLQQVLMNLVINSMHALDDRYSGADPNKTLSIVARQVSVTGHDHLRLTVEDHGSGIAAAHLDRIFDPFFTTKGRDKGTGLGLSVSEGIVRSHDGAISVESVENEYTRFHVDLPLGDGGSSITQRAVEALETAHQTGSRYHV